MTALFDLSRSLSALAEGLSPHVVSVWSGSGAASGFVWRENLVVTAEEALAGEGEITVVAPDGARLPATLVGRDPSTDVALLRVEAGPSKPVALDLGTSRRLGELALALGRGRDGAVAALGLVGTVGPAWRSLRGGTIDARLGLDLRLPRSAEGGLAADAEGRAFGMTVLGPRRATLVIPAATVERVATQLLARGRIVRGYLGVGLQPLRLDGTGEPGLLVISLDEAGPGRQAGLVQGDILLRMGGEALGSTHALMARLGPDAVGRSLEVEILRGGERRVLAVVVGEHPAS
jgi:S1-C subfamily serine protease